MKQHENALLIFAEELGEVAQEFLDAQKQVFKAIRFGIDEQRDLPTSNRERIQAEWNDLIGAIKNLSKYGINLSIDFNAVEIKQAKIDRYNRYSESLGVLDGYTPEIMKLNVNLSEPTKNPYAANGKSVVRDAWDDGYHGRMRANGTEVYSRCYSEGVAASIIDGKGK